jgi:hypothetical protein
MIYKALKRCQSVTYCERVGSGRQHRAKVEGVHRTMSLVQQTPSYGVRCGDSRNKEKRENKKMNLKLVAGSWLSVPRTIVAT